MTIQYIIDARFELTPRDSQAFDAFLDQVMDELEKIHVESDFTASLAKFEASFMIVAADESFDALVDVMNNLRAALHAAKCGTPGWPTADQIRFVATRVSNSDLVDA